MATGSPLPQCLWGVGDSVRCRSCLHGVTLEGGNAWGSPRPAWVQFVQPMFHTVIWGRELGGVLFSLVQSLSVSLQPHPSRLIGPSHRPREVALSLPLVHVGDHSRVK